MTSMMSFHMPRIFFLVFIITLMPACVGKKLQYFPRSQTDKLFSQEKEGLKIILSLFNSSESRNYFGVDLNSYGYVPLHLRIHNTSNAVYVLKASEVGLSLVAPKKIMSLLYHDTWSFLLWTTIPSIIFAWPVLGITLPAAWGMRSDNKKITESLTESALKKNEIIEIQPHESLEKFIFTHEEDIPTYTNMSFLKKKTESWVSFTIDFSTLKRLS